MSEDGLVEQVRALASALEEARDFVPWGRMAKTERAYRNIPHLLRFTEATLESYKACLSSLLAMRQALQR